MNETKQKLIQAGCAVLDASRTELYVAMRFLDIALSSLGYEMDLSMRTIGTDSRSIRFNPRFLLELYFKAIDPVSLNRQGEDSGTRYRTGVYYTDEKDLPVIEEVFAEQQ